jgi:glucan phosphoethanolaminetransferase (alkaline phosphatase superfamily)
MRTILKTSCLCLGVALAFHVLNITDTAQWVLAEPLPYLVHACVQLTIEASLLTVIALWMLRRRWIRLTAAWLTVVVGWALLHVIDVHMVRLMDLSLWHAFQSTVGEGWQNFIEILHASNVPLDLYAATTLAATLFVAGLFAGFKRKLSQDLASSSLPPEGLGVWTSLTCMSLLGAVALMDCTSADGCSTSGVQKLSRSLPWKRRMVELHNDEHLELRPSAQAWSGLPQTAASTAQFHLESRPPVFLFIIESLRADALTESTAPHLHHFAQRHYSSSQSYSNANATPLSWLAILSGLQPSRWGSDAVMEMDGSPILRAFKNAGYDLHVHSSSRLSYYELDRKLFGTGQELLKSSYLALAELDLPAWQRDLMVLDHLSEHVAASSCEGEFHIVFLEGTHFAYSWPDGQTVFEPVLAPAEGLLAFWRLADLKSLKNRYYNSIHFLDRQLGDFFALLQNRSLYDRSQIILTSDHGEEFLEHGHLFHASALDEEQVHVPLYWKIDSVDTTSADRDMLCSHVDILPTLAHVLTGKENAFPQLDGYSILATNRPSYAISWRYNFQAAPHEFAIHTASGMLRGSLSEPLEAAASTQVTLSSGHGPLTRTPVRRLLQDPACKAALERYFRMR